jgi:hypothetical protein
MIDGYFGGLVKFAFAATFLAVRTPMIAQSLPFPCKVIDRSITTDRTLLSAHSGQSTPALRRRLVNLLQAGWPRVDWHGIQAVWNEDSVSVLWTLAELAATDEWDGRLTASAAASSYRRLSGASEPLLTWMEASASDYQRDVGLSAISWLTSQDHEEIVFRYACDAAWLLIAWANDTSYSHLSEVDGRVNAPKRSARVLVEATRLIRGKRRGDLLEIVAQVNRLSGDTTIRP